MDLSVMSIIDDPVFDGESSDNFSPSPVTKPKAKAALKNSVNAIKAAPKRKVEPARKTEVAAKPKKEVLLKKRAKMNTEDEDDNPVLRNNPLHSESLLSATPPSAKRQKKAPAPRKGAGRPLQEVKNGPAAFDGTTEPNSKKSSATEQYQKLTHLEQIVKRPDTYIGSVERNEKQMWVYNTEMDSMEMREVSFVPGLYKIFDEILVNAADNKQRDKNMNAIKVTINREIGEISVWNNGRGIPIEIHEKEQIYIPEMIFGHLLTSSNYDDEEQKVTGGRNGYGAKLCNIFSTKFNLETADAKSKQKYKQTWTSNMSKMGKASIVAYKGEDFTKITFTPDFQKFKMDGIDTDFEALVKRRVYDIAGTLRGVKVYLNGDQLRVTNFKKYMEMYTKAIKRERGEEAMHDTSDIITETPDARWEIGFAVSDGTFQQVSFVNSIATTSGGTHVNYVADQIGNKLIEIVKKRNKGGPVLKTNQIRNHIFLFVNCLIVNPAFTSQTKEQLTTKSSQFGSKCVVSDEFLKKVAKTEVITNILAFAQQKADQILKKSDGNRRSRMDNPKLTDANKAGTKDGYQCTLILTEGDSAKGLAMAGRSVVGPDLFGVFPLRGKLLNVRDASIDQVSKNAEIQNIKNILGLKHKTNYTDCKSLRYGHIMIMTDQDHDGSHIKGLLINFLQVSFPSLLRIPEFLIEFITPIVKVFKGDPKQPTKSRSFFTMPEYEAWKAENNNGKGWELKYYKGLGTSTTEDAQVYFRDLDKHLKEFHVMEDKEPELIELAFSKKKADERKEWLRQFKPGTYLDPSIKEITYTDFVNKELILFSMADNIRSIPSVVDGLKPGQRKVMYTAFKRNIRKDVKVTELAGHTQAQTAYHHGDASLQMTIVGLAQSFVGSNNINLLEPSGNFGSRLQGGSDCASSRYIFTRLSPFARRVFSQLDEPVLRYNTDDDRTIEPEVYVPVVPMILVNGADGIGTGWSSNIPNYNPEDIVENLKLMMDGQEPKPMSPWFRDFKGTVTQVGPDRYEFGGVIRQTSDTEIEITELPIRLWTQDFKDKLVDILKAEKAPSWIKEYDDYNTHKQVRFVVRLEEKHMNTALEEGLEKRFKLTKSIATSNLVAFDSEGRITKYATVEDILKEFFAVRIKLYEKRKAYQLNEMSKELEKLSNQARFVQMIIDGKLIVSKKRKMELVTELKQKKFKPIPKSTDALKQGEIEQSVENQNEEEEVEAAANSYDYLLGMPIWSLTRERVEKLLKQMGDQEVEIDTLIQLSKEDLWKTDLEEFIKEWRFQLEDEERRQKKVANMGRRVSSKLKTQINPTKKRKATENSLSESEFENKKPRKPPVIRSVIAKPGGLLSDLALPSKKQSRLEFSADTAKPTTKAVEVGAPIDKDIWMTIDGNQDFDIEPPIAPVFTKPKAITAAKGPKSLKSKKIESGGSDDGRIIVPAESIAPSRIARAAARKPVNYNVLSDSELDNDDDMLFDVGKMVKGFGPAATAEATSSARPLFAVKASLSRLGSSAGLAARKSISENAMDPDEDSNDETDYTRLAPVRANSGKKTTAKSAMSSDNDNDDESDIDMGVKRATFLGPASQTLKSTAAAKSTLSMPIASRATAPKAKASAKSAPKFASRRLKEKKMLPLSPAAKAYAAKQGCVTIATAPIKRSMVIDSDNESMVDKLADELLSEDEDDMVGGDAKVVPGIAGERPSRRVAATAARMKKIWAVDDEEIEEESETEGETAEFSDSD